MSSDDLVGTWRLQTVDGVPLEPGLRDEWVLRGDGSATLTHLGPGKWAYGDSLLTIQPDYLRRARRRVRTARTRLRVPAFVRYEVVRLFGDQLQLRYAPDERTRQGLFSPAIRRLPQDAPGLSKASMEAGLIPWALDYPDGKTATLYLPDDGRGPDTPAELVAEVERRLLQVMGLNKVA